MNEDLEINAMAIIASEMSKLDENARRRVLQWLLSREGVSSSGMAVSVRPLPQNDVLTLTSGDQSLSDFFYSVDLQNDMERAVAVAYYLQVVGGREDLTSQEINDELKHLGYPISNITKALTRAMGQTPRLIHQTRKSGTSQQARKKYKVTQEGIKFLQAKSASRSFVPESQ